MRNLRRIGQLSNASLYHLDIGAAHCHSQDDQQYQHKTQHKIAGKGLAGLFGELPCKSGFSK
jgi:hypothetical protein